MTTALFGGSFDPVHNGHQDLIKRLSRIFDRVVIMPTAVSPFKMQGGSASAQHRLAMLRLCDFAKNVAISDYEISKGGVSYTADTLRYLTESGYQNLSVVIGSEELPNLYKWKDADYLKKFKFFVVPRPGFIVSDTAQKSEFNYTIADFEGLDVSSAMLKVDVAFGKLPATPLAVAGYISKNGLYSHLKKYTDAYEVFGLKSGRIEHTYRCIKAGIALAKRFNADINKVVLALVLHDIGKYTDREKLKKKSIHTQDFIEALPEPLRHAYYSEAIAKQYFGIEDKSVLSAIRNHTTCDCDMDEVAEITALADYIEDGRDFEGVDLVRRTAQISLKKAMMVMLKTTLDYLQSQNADIGEKSFLAYEFYKKECEN